MVRTLKNELEFNCQVQMPPESKIIAWIIGHVATLLHLDTVGSDGQVPFERWRSRGHHMGRCVFGERVWYRVGPLTDRTKAEDTMESGISVGFSDGVQRVHFDCEWRSDNCPDNPKETCVRKVGQPSTYRSGHGTDQGTGKERQFDPWESGWNATPDWTKHPSPSRLLKRDRRRECT